MQCPLCLSTEPKRSLRGADARRYFLCNACALIFADPVQHLSVEEDKAYYGLHRNSLEDAGYVAFLKRVVQPALPYLDSGMRGLDYGCGPGPTLSQLLQREGIACTDYDPLFRDVPLQPPYDFVFSTECFEHFRRPAEDVARIAGLLRPGGLLAIMTERWTTTEAFSGWHYTRDPTHVAFWHARTFDYLCERHGFAPLWSDERRVTILRRTVS